MHGECYLKVHSTAIAKSGKKALKGINRTLWRPAAKSNKSSSFRKDPSPYRRPPAFIRMIEISWGRRRNGKGCCCLDSMGFILAKGPLKKRRTPWCSQPGNAHEGKSGIKSRILSPDSDWLLTKITTPNSAYMDFGYMDFFGDFSVVIWTFSLINGSIWTIT